MGASLGRGKSGEQDKSEFMLQNMAEMIVKIPS
jgi:hypothetical protein